MNCTSNVYVYKKGSLKSCFVYKDIGYVELFLRVPSVGVLDSLVYGGGTAAQLLKAQGTDNVKCARGLFGRIFPV